jgi:hypothetical protein
MGGKVGVESEPEKGSRFWVELRAGEVKRRRADRSEVQVNALDIQGAQHHA